MRAGQVLARRVLGALRQVVQLVDDVLDARDGAVGRIEALALDDEILVRADARDVLLDQVEIVDDHLERVVDLVRHPDGDLAERGEAVVTADRAEVLGESDRPQLLAGIGLDDGPRDGDRKQRAALGDEDRLEVAHLALHVRAVAVAHGGHDLAGFRLVGIQPRDVLAQHLFGRVAERAAAHRRCRR